MPTHTENMRLRWLWLLQVLAKSCKPIPVMLMGALMGKQYPVKKYVNVTMIVSGVALFMYSGDGSGKPNAGSGGQVSGTR
jgi:solute carrier family 35 (UDP-galactose transporter), member B1